MNHMPKEVSADCIPSASKVSLVALLATNALPDDPGYNSSIHRFSCRTLKLCGP